MTGSSTSCVLKDSSELGRKMKERLGAMRLPDGSEMERSMFSGSSVALGGMPGLEAKGKMVIESLTVIVT